MQIPYEDIDTKYMYYSTFVYQAYIILVYPQYLCIG